MDVRPVICIGLGLEKYVKAKNNSVTLLQNKYHIYRFIHHEIRAWRVTQKVPIEPSYVKTIFLYGQRRTAWGVLTAISGVSRAQGLEEKGMAGPG
jgi:hypothetical protein